MAWLDEMIETRFSQFEGLRISGTVPLQQGLVNEALGEWLAGAPSDGSAPAGRSGSRVKELLPLVKKVQVRAETGVIHVDFEIGV